MSWKLCAAGAFPNQKVEFFLEGGLYGRYTQWDISSWQRDLGYPQFSSARWPGLPPKSPDAVMVSPIAGESHTACFFFDDECIEVHHETGEALPGFPKKIHDHFDGVWGSGVDAVLYAGTSEYVFFKGDEYGIVGLDRKMKSGYPHKLSSWNGMWTHGVDAATWATHGGHARGFVFKGNECIKVALPSRNCEAAKPIDTVFDGLLPIASARTFFEPQIHGFKFTNFFDLDARMFGQPTWEMGLCGGMVFGALDRIRHLIPVPPNTSPPGEKCPDVELLWELVKRQAATLDPGLVGMLALQALPDQDFMTDPGAPSISFPGAGPGTPARPPSFSDGAESRTQKTWWPRIKKTLDDAQPAIVCLIRVPLKGDPSKNHQVLAVGYDQMAHDLVRLNVYDPNHPGGVQVIIFNPTPGQRLNGSQDDGSPLRAFMKVEEPPSMY
jgi:hypothetical protein